MVRVVVVTGGASGIGLAAVRRFAAAGDRVAILDWNGRAAEAVAAGIDNAIAIKCDVSDERQVAAAFAEVVTAFGRVDVLINNAGIIGDQRSILDMSAESVRSILSVNLTGAYIVACEAARAMAAAGGGAIVNTASLGGLVAVPNRIAYGASKAALINLTRSLARDWAARGVRVNAVLPGFVLTEILAKLLRERNADPTAMEKAIPLGRLADPDEIAGAIEHLARTTATGVALSVDGGFGAFGGVSDASAGGKVRPEGHAKGRNVLIVGGSAAADSTVRCFAANGDRVLAIGGGDSVKDAIAQLRRVDVLVNRIEGDEASRTGDVSPSDFARLVERDLTGALQILRAAAPAMIAEGAGAIVNILPPPSGNRVQDAARAGLVMATKALACEWAGHGLRVNAVRFDDPAAADQAIVFLASPAASYVTGSLYSA